VTARAATLLLLLALPALACSQSPARVESSEHVGPAARLADVARVVVIGDVHGAHSSLVEILAATGLIDAESHWIGGNTHLVSLGDLLDRGPDSRAVLDLLMRLQAEAAAQGGRVHVVLGNHEVMNLMGDLRYLTAPDYAAFAAEETETLRASAYLSYASHRDVADEAALVLFDQTYPRGYFARHEAFGANGLYGAWLLSLPAVVVVNDTAYVHGGLPPLVATTSLDSLNAAIATKLRRYLELREYLASAGLLQVGDMTRDREIAQALLESAAEPAAELREFLELDGSPELGADGPLWYRGSVYCKPLLERPILEAALEQLAVRRVVVGHTPTVDRRAHSLYDGKLLMLDTGMLAAYYDGRPTALVIESEHVHVQYAEPRERSALEPDGPDEPYPLSEQELVAALEHATVATVERTPDDAPWPVTLTADTTTVSAAFFPRMAGRAAELELAADALDDLIGTALVPPTVARTIDGTEGALQLRYPRAVTETQRVARQLGFTGWCPIEPQLDLMRTFDLLTYNRGRTADNVIYRNDFSDLVLTDHRNAFGLERALPPGFDLSELALPPALIAELRELDTPTLTEALGSWVDARRIRALLARRDRLLENR
jgi:hypothetical protein